MDEQVLDLVELEEQKGSALDLVDRLQPVGHEGCRTSFNRHQMVICDDHDCVLGSLTDYRECDCQVCGCPRLCHDTYGDTGRCLQCGKSCGLRFGPSLNDGRRRNEVREAL